MAKSLRFRDRSQITQHPARPHRSLLEQIYASVFRSADIIINGQRPWDVQIHDPRFYRRILLHGSVGLGESYMDGWWDVAALDECFTRALAARFDKRLVNLPRLGKLFLNACANLQNMSRARHVAEAHYDINNDFYRAMLDERMVYTCGYWRDADTLNQAQLDKLELVCQKLELQPGMRVLDIGCGWGSFAKYAAEHHGVQVVGITISQAQAEFAKADCAHLPVEIRLEDYRLTSERFDRIVSLGMFEHVGSKNYQTYVDCVRRNLADDGLFLLHTIGRNEHGTAIDPWVTKYIFPNSEIPTLPSLIDTVARQFIVEDLHNFGTDYDKTLMAWFNNFHRTWPQFERQFPKRFYRMWKYYLLMFAAAFRSRHLQLWQFVLAPRRIGRGYQRPLI